MEVGFLSKLVKPSIPTPPTLQNFKISFTDELAPPVYVPLILYYPAPSYDQHDPFRNICSKLEHSLSKTLTDFYPLAGRFESQNGFVDCSDQGVEYVEAKANFSLSEMLGIGRDFKADLVNDFLPSGIGRVGEIQDAMLCIKVTTFECGGLAIGMLFSHKLSDMGTISTFINNWAASNREDLGESEKYSPIFNAANYFPSKGLPELDMSVPRSIIGVTNAAKRFWFKGKAISALREKIGFTSNARRMPSKVQLVVALLWKALVHVDQAKNEQSKASFVIQAVNLRDKVIPCLPENSCGNFWGLATSRLAPGEGGTMDFQGFFYLLHNSIKKIATDCAKVLTHGEEGYGVVINPFLEVYRTLEDPDVNFYVFTSWCKFSFYKADFGWGKPVWASTGKLPLQNFIFMLDDQEGDGVEAWVHLDDNRMKELEQDFDIQAYTT